MDDNDKGVKLKTAEDHIAEVLHHFEQDDDAIMAYLDTADGESADDPKMWRNVTLSQLTESDTVKRALVKMLSTMLENFQTGTDDEN